ncbi:MAG: hypothetical protein J6L81_05890 [Clostridia bacterium]|nr:hypothetical protein [Clostridia bacterium]
MDNKKIYPIIIYNSDGGINRIDFSGMDPSASPVGLTDSFDMTRDGICLWAVSDTPPAIEGASLPTIAAPYISYDNTRDISPVNVSCSVPAWLKDEADKRSVDLSALLQRALLDLIDSEAKEKEE